MADTLTIEVSGFEFLDRIERAAAQLERPSELMQRIGATLESNIAQRFISKTDPAGNAWLPLAASTLARKNKAGKRASLLVLTGHGLDELTHNAGADYVEVGFGVAYMGYHETGTSRMPRRGLLTADWQSGTLGREDESDVLAVVEDFLGGLGLS